MIDYIKEKYSVCAYLGLVVRSGKLAKFFASCVNVLIGKMKIKGVFLPLIAETDENENYCLHDEFNPYQL